MSDLAIRIVVITALVAIALLVAWALERRRSIAPRRIPETGLDPGVYLFSSQSCPDCAPARETLIKALGADGFMEMAWDDDPVIFEQLDIGEVPASMIVAADGSASCWFGDPDRMLAKLGP